MITREQIAVAVSTVAFLGGLALVVTGAVTGEHPRLADIGAGVTLGSLPFVILARVRKQQHITRETAESLRREGYRLGLEHAGRGLLNPPPITDDGEGAPTDHVATVHHLYATRSNLAATDERRKRAR
ncbi:hypothetical protein ACF1BU_14150 [Streptomyces sp. NPDC014724]|uniref:hypothetical protein n=1 Tax=unclassified Streptomyces TaxID=2593676 RepID=UPI0036F4FBA6